MGVCSSHSAFLDHFLRMFLTKNLSGKRPTGADARSFFSNILSGSQRASNELWAVIVTTPPYACQTRPFSWRSEQPRYPSLGVAQGSFDTEDKVFHIASSSLATSCATGQVGS